MTRHVTIALVPAGLLLAAGCMAKGQDPALQKEAARDALAIVLKAAAQKDVKSAEAHLGVTEFLALHSQGRPKNLQDMTPQERSEAYSACFNQFISCTETTTLRDAAAIDKALAEGTLAVHMKMKRAEAAFCGLTAEKQQPLHYNATLALYYDGKWRVASCEPDLGR
jgi:hypothetical protein